MEDDDNNITEKYSFTSSVNGVKFELVKDDECFELCINDVPMAIMNLNDVETIKCICDKLLTKV